MQDQQQNELPISRVIRTWAPLAAGWLLVGVEMPLINAVMARLPGPTISLAAYGSVVFSLALIIESPIIMLLSASTALSRDWASYLKLRRFMFITSGILTLLHVLVAFTPLYDVVVVNLLGVPDEIVEPARWGLMALTPWTGAIAYRRFQQGMLIRFGHADVVGSGAVIRIMGLLTALGLGYLIGGIPGTVVGAMAHSTSVTVEAVYAGLRARKVIRFQLKPAPAVEPLGWEDFARFYIPLAMTSLLGLLWRPIGSAALSRMPLALESLAVYPVVSGLLMLLNSSGWVYKEVVVALIGEPRSLRSLRRFTGILVLGVMVMFLVAAVTPVALLWFRDLSALPPEMVEMARISFWLALPMPVLVVLQNWFQGIIVSGKNTRGITESTVVYLLVVVILLVLGVLWQREAGVYVALVASTIAFGAQTGWLWLRSREVVHSQEAMDLVIESVD